MKVWLSEEGQAHVLMTVSMMVVLGFMGLSIDIGGLFRSKQFCRTSQMPLPHLLRSTIISTSLQQARPLPPKLHLLQTA